jgi:NADH-quinone oxidoreductase subunit C
MTEQEKSEGAAKDAPAETPAASGEAAPAPEAGAAPAHAAEAAQIKQERPARAAEGKAPAKQPPPPGSIADLIREVLPDLKFEAYQGLSDVIVEIGRDDVAKALPVLKDDPRLDLKFLRVLFGVDHLDEGMDVIYQLLSLDKKHEVTVKTRLPKDDLRVASAASVWKAADWHERETRDMFGIVFEGHPHLVPLLLPEDMTDHYPLRKDNPLAEIEEWQGELLGEDVGQAGHIPSGSGYEAAGGGDKEAGE